MKKKKITKRAARKELTGINLAALKRRLDNIEQILRVLKVALFTHLK